MHITCTLSLSSQRAAGHGSAGVCRDVPGEASAAPVRGVRVRLPSEHAQQRAGVHWHQRDPAAPPSKGETKVAFFFFFFVNAKLLFFGPETFFFYQ